MDATPETNPPCEFLSELHAAAWSGISARLLRQWAQQGKLTKYKPAGGRRVLYRLEELRRLIEDGKQTKESNESHP